MSDLNNLGIFVQNGKRRIVVSSRDVARVFEKEHKNVLRDIQNLHCSESFTQLNFELSTYEDATGRELPQYLMTRDGFVILAMGFTGEKAMQFKEAYIAAFNAMEKVLLEEEILAAGDEKPVIPVAAIDFKTARFALDGVMAFRDVMPITMKKRIMRRYYELIGVSPSEGLSPEEEAAEARIMDIDDLVNRFVDERCMTTAGARLSRADFYLCLSEWCAVHGYTCPSRCAAVRSMNRLRRFRMGRSNEMRYWEGVRCA